ncbi:MAG: NADH:flavin oxidoreductase [Candidatus Sumerlaeia bacterium]|nr:NADH:flavin oxidoreductase [Candidatus Sumerlaeia bacterium]
MLFQPIDVGGITLKNRFMRSATHEWLATEDGFVTEKMLDFYQTLAQGGVGLIIPGYAYVDPGGKSSVRQNAIYEDKFIPGYQALVKIVHQYGAKIALQIVHGGRQSKPELIGMQTPIAPSAVYDKSSGITPRAMSSSEITHIQEQFVSAITRAKKAGFDAVQLHIAHGFLLSEFISPYTNQRTDIYGGSTENRCRFIIEIIQKAKREVGNDFPIFAKLNSTDGIRGGLTEEESARVAKLLAIAGVALIEVSGGMAEAGAIAARKNILTVEQEAYFLPAARLIKQALKESALSTRVALVGGLRSLSIMHQIIENGEADLISLSRPLIREPDLILKFQRGEKDRADCISCNGCYSPDGIRCVLINPQ